MKTLTLHGSAHRPGLVHVGLGEELVQVLHLHVEALVTALRLYVLVPSPATHAGPIDGRGKVSYKMTFRVFYSVGSS